MARRSRSSRRNTDPAVWECATCNAQMMGAGPRCGQHNPTPEQREADPQRFRRDTFAKHVRDGKV